VTNSLFRLEGHWVDTGEFYEPACPHDISGFLKPSQIVRNLCELEKSRRNLPRRQKAERRRSRNNDAYIVFSAYAALHPSFTRYPFVLDLTCNSFLTSKMDHLSEIRVRVFKILTDPSAKTIGLSGCTCT